MTIQGIVLLENLTDHPYKYGTVMDKLKVRIEALGVSSSALNTTLY